MADNSAQLELISRQSVSVPVEYQIQTARNCKSRAHAIYRCAEISGLTPKQIYTHLSLSQGTWSKIMDWDRPIGEKAALLDPDLVEKLMERCGNIVPVYYDAMRANCELIPIKTDLEAKLAASEAENAELRRKLAWTVELAVGRRT